MQQFPVEICFLGVQTHSSMASETRAAASPAQGHIPVEHPGDERKPGHPHRVLPPHEQGTGLVTLCPAALGMGKDRHRELRYGFVKVGVKLSGGVMAGV